MSFSMNVSLDPASLARAQKMQNWQPVLEQNLILGINTSLGTMQEYAIGYCFSTFMNPQGGLEGAFGTQVQGGMPVTGVLMNDAPQAWRREVGFSGKTDSLGRYYPSDPGIKYMANTLQANTQVIYQDVYVAAQAALTELGV